VGGPGIIVASSDGGKTWTSQSMGSWTALYDVAAIDRSHACVVGERGTMLSVGQKQRISLARAFLKNPPVIILDEPTSALDRDTEKALGRTLTDIARGRTTFIITHRTPLVDIADRVFELKAGRLAEVKGR